MNYTQQDLIKVIRFKTTSIESASRLGITVDDYKKVKKQYYIDLKGDLKVSDENIDILVDKIISSCYNESAGTGRIEGILSTEPLSAQEIEVKFKVDTNKWKLSSYWNKERPSGGYFVSANVVKIKLEELESNKFQDKFTDFLLTYTPKSKINTYLQSLDKPYVSLILPRQDGHFNKFSIDGKNDIIERLDNILDKTINILNKAKTLNNIEDITYIVGSDQFNSEWTGLTSKGTPQQNILTYEDSFEKICQHEVDTIELLRSNCTTLYINYVCGNHDHFVGWHLIKWLEAYFRNTNVVFDTSTLCRKYYKFGNTAIMFNHGDAIKPEDLAHTFPIEYKKNWSSCEHYLIMTGDKHHIKSIDIHGIHFYQIPQLSNAKSSWDDKQGYTKSKAEMTAFIITKNNGLSDILKELI